MCFKLAVTSPGFFLFAYGVFFFITVLSYFQGSVGFVMETEMSEDHNFGTGQQPHSSCYTSRYIRVSCFRSQGLENHKAIKKFDKTYLQLLRILREEKVRSVMPATSSTI